MEFMKSFIIRLVIGLALVFVLAFLIGSDLEYLDLSFIIIGTVFVLYSVTRFAPSGENNTMGILRDTRKQMTEARRDERGEIVIEPKKRFSPFGYVGILFVITYWVMTAIGG